MNNSNYFKDMFEFIKDYRKLVFLIFFLKYSFKFKFEFSIK